MIGGFRTLHAAMCLTQASHKNDVRPHPKINGTRRYIDTQGNDSIRAYKESFDQSMGLDTRIARLLIPRIIQ